ncbi:MAG: acylphosphatase [Chitinophagales bacterium]|nr:MAG: acylphosphatase [Chitinophagales bacterium]
MINVKHRNIRVTGKVQGVWYRDSARKKALELGITGFVRNEADGSVYIEAEGTAEQLDQFTAWCRQGPPLARVEKVEYTEAQPRHFSSFEILRSVF